MASESGSESESSITGSSLGNKPDRASVPKLAKTSKRGRWARNQLANKQAEERINWFRNLFFLGAAFSFMAGGLAYFWGQSLLTVFTVSLGCLLSGFSFAIKNCIKSAPDASQETSIDDTSDKMLGKLKKVTSKLNEKNEAEDTESPDQAKNVATVFQSRRNSLNKQKDRASQQSSKSKSSLFSPS